MLIAGGITTNVPVDGQYTDLTLNFSYPTTNPSSYEGASQNTTPPIELSNIEVRITDNPMILTNPDDVNIKYHHSIKGCPEITATYNEQTEEWEGVIDKIIIPNVPVRTRWYAQNRCESRLGVWADWSSVWTIADTPAEIPVPVITSIMTNKDDQVRVKWTDVGLEVPSFLRYEIFKEELNTQARLETNAIIVNQ